MNETQSISVSVGFCRLCGEPLFDGGSQGLVDSTGCCWCWVPGLHDVPREGTGPHAMQEWRRAA